MDYRGKNCFVTGGSGFIGSFLSTELAASGANVIHFVGDIRDKSLMADQFSHSIDYVFHFGSPSSQVLFSRNNQYCVDATISGFINLANMCREFGAKLIYPSTGLISQGKYNSYARCKKILEDIHLNSDLDAIGLRIYATYGNGESHKRDYASPVHLFTRDIMSGRRPVIFGDGSQERDFIHISDLVDCIMTLAETCNSKIIELGSGCPRSFNEIIDIINNQAGTSIRPTYIQKPVEYYDSTKCDVTEMLKFCNIPRMSIHDGIKAMLST